MLRTGSDNRAPDDTISAILKLGIQIMLFAVYDGDQLPKLVLLSLDFFNGTSSANSSVVGAVEVERIAEEVVTVLASEAVIVERG